MVDSCSLTLLGVRSGGGDRKGVAAITGKRRSQKGTISDHRQDRVKVGFIFWSFPLILSHSLPINHHQHYHYRLVLTLALYCSQWKQLMDHDQERQNRRWIMTGRRNLDPIPAR